MSDRTREVAPVQFLTEPTRHSNPRAVHPTDPSRKIITHQLGDAPEDENDDKGDDKGDENTPPIEPPVKPPMPDNLDL